MRWNSIRVRLTLWNVGVFALILAGLGATLCYSVQADVSGSIDRGLAEGARWNQDAYEQRTGPFHPPRFGSWSRSTFPGSRDITGPPRPGGNRDLRGPGPGPRSQAGVVERGATSTRSGESDRRLPFKRPAILDLNGKGLPYRFSEKTPWDPATVQRSAGGEAVFSNVFIEGEEFRVYSAPLKRDGQVLGVIQLTHSLSEQKRLNEGLMRRLLMLIPLGLVIAALGGIFLTDRALRPVRKITQAAEQLGAEDLSRRLEVPTKDELGELAMTFNGMIGRLEEAFARLGTAYQQLETAYEKHLR